MVGVVLYIEHRVTQHSGLRVPSVNGSGAMPYREREPRSGLYPTAWLRALHVTQRHWRVSLDEPARLGPAVRARSVERELAHTASLRSESDWDSSGIEPMPADVIYGSTKLTSSPRACHVASLRRWTERFASGPWDVMTKAVRPQAAGHTAS